MKNLLYSNIHDRKGNKKEIAVSDNIFEEVIHEFKGHFGFGGENLNIWVVDVAEWNRLLEYLNEKIDLHIGAIFIKKETKFNIK